LWHGIAVGDAGHLEDLIVAQSAKHQADNKLKPYMPDRITADHHEVTGKSNDYWFITGYQREPQAQHC
jgi:hypothetical protein